MRDRVLPMRGVAIAAGSAALAFAIATAGWTVSAQGQAQGRGQGAPAPPAPAPGQGAAAPGQGAGRGRGQAPQIAAIGLGGEDVVLFMHLPDITPGVIGSRWTLRKFQVSRGKENTLSIGEEISAGGAAFAGADQPAIPARRIHDVNLVAGPVACVILEDNRAVVGGKVGFGVLTSKGELADVLQVFLRRLCRDLCGRRKLFSPQSSDEERK